MSAFICSPEHIAALAAATHEFSISQDPVQVATHLMQENIASVRYRYNDADDLPGPSIPVDFLVPAAIAYTVHFVQYGLPDGLTRVGILKLIDCLMYQSCEHPEWESSLAYRYLNWLRGAIMPRLPGYREAQWELSAPIEHIDRLFYTTTTEKEN